MKLATADAARGKWRGILSAFGVEKSFLQDRHGPCPWCEGTDRYRFDNKQGNGTYFCSRCGAGDGFMFLQNHKGWDFKTAAAEVDKIVSNVSTEPARKQVTDETKLALSRVMWGQGRPLEAQDVVCRYLGSRNVLPAALPLALRFHDACPAPHGAGEHPAMLALVQDANGNPCNVHRTFLGPSGKADIDTPRAMMPGSLPEGSAIRLYELRGGTMGIAEGIETAIAAAKRFKVPVWAAINSTMLAKWTPPEGIAKVLIMADNDAAFGGQAAAYALAHRLATGRKPVEVEVHVPEQTGTDWADLA